MLSYIRDVLLEAERSSDISTRDDAFEHLRRLGLDDFGEILLNMPDPDLPKLSSLLPAMSAVDVQKLWTGNSGYQLLRQSCNFARSVSYNYSKLVGQSLKPASILDYGCGYGRIARLMYYFVNSGSVFGVDPWERSIEECSKANMGPNFIQSSYLPDTLPVGDRRFDLVYAFSVFTHLSLNATRLALAAIRNCIADDGILCITIRPVEYWDTGFSAANADTCKTMKHLHIAEGFAFAPHNLPPVNGEVTYGDTSISLKWLGDNVSDWSVVGLDRSLEDPYQIYVFLKTNSNQPAWAQHDSSLPNNPL